MTTTLVTLDLSRGPARIRLVFSAAMATGAFTSSSYYQVTNTDGNGPNPTSVVGVFAVQGSGNIVEIAVEPELAQGAQYNVIVTNAPAVDTSLVSGTLGALQGLPTQQLPDEEPQTSDLELLLFNRDLVWDGNDVVETSTGDLAVQTGRQNWYDALMRRMTSYGMLWDPAYSPHADQFVNAPDLYKTPLAGRFVAQAKADDRTLQATITVTPYSSDTTGNGWLFALTVVAQDGLDAKTLNIPPSATGT